MEDTSTFSLPIIAAKSARSGVDATILIFADVPEPLKGTGITLIIAGMLALAFMGFAGLGAA